MLIQQAFLIFQSMHKWLTLTFDDKRCHIIHRSLLHIRRSHKDKKLKFAYIRCPRMFEVKLHILLPFQYICPLKL